MSITSQFMIYVFSFNRGEFLSNCLTSIEKTTKDIDVCIIDDNSFDFETLNILNAYSDKYIIINNNRQEEFERKTGGLTGSMNLAIEHATKNGIEYALFIQDDMQFTRLITDDDLVSVIKYFEVIQNSIQISTSFIRKLSSDNFLVTSSINLKANAYIRSKKYERGKSNFSDTGVFHVERVNNIFGSFEVGEAVNSAKAISLGLTCGSSINPFMCWLPYPVSYRGKKRDFKHRVFEYFGKSGFYPIDIMQASEAEDLLQREPTIIPVMENFLTVPDCPRYDVWSTGGGEYNFVCYGGFLSKLFVGMRIMKKRIGLK